MNGWFSSDFRSRILHAAFALLILFPLAALAQDSLKVISAPVTCGFRRCDSRKIDTIIIHSICNPGAADKYALASIQAVMKRYNVSSHYVILRDGQVCRLVNECDVAWHAGKSRMPKPPYRQDLNGSSIGIELACDTSASPTEAQYSSLVRLVKNVETRYPIKYIFGHKEVASGRKTDPWNFDWTRFNKEIGSGSEPGANSQ